MAKHCSSSMRSKSGLLWRPGRRVCAGVCAGRSNTMPTNPTPGGARRHPPASVRDGGAQDCEQGGCAPPLATASALARLMPARCALGESPGEGGEVGIHEFWTLLPERNPFCASKNLLLVLPTLSLHTLPSHPSSRGANIILALDLGDDLVAGVKALQCATGKPHELPVQRN